VTQPILDGPISAAWRDYALKVLPPDVPKVQVVECKRAFFAGARALLGIQVSDMPSDENGACELMDKINDELLEFNKRVQDGRE
jgi:hypothetical protein